ncbi:hypothetical protein D3C86_1852460 [compost metagenome]
MSVRREARSTSRPAGMDSSRNGSVWAICSQPVSAGPAESMRTAASGAAAKAICSENWAKRFDQAMRLKADGRVVAGGFCMERSSIKLFRGI